jgi:hypothetical protein
MEVIVAVFDHNPANNKANACVALLSLTESELIDL